MNGIIRVIAVAICVGLLSPGCATIINGKKKTIFLHMSEDAARETTFFLDGKQVDWQMKQYSAREVSRTSDTITYEVTYLPALTVSSPARYVALAIERGGRREEMLLKRDLMRGYKFYIYLNWMTFGVGTLVDVMGEGLFGMDEVTITDAAPVAEVTP